MRTDTMNKVERKKLIRNVRASLAVEDLELNRFNAVCSIQYLKGRISSDEAIDKITQHIKNRMANK